MAVAALVLADGPDVAEVAGLGALATGLDAALAGAALAGALAEVDVGPEFPDLIGPEFPDDIGFGIAGIPPLGVITIGRGIAGIPPLGVVAVGRGIAVPGFGSADIPDIGVWSGARGNGPDIDSTGTSPRAAAEPGAIGFGLVACEGIGTPGRPGAGTPGRAGAGT